MNKEERLEYLRGELRSESISYGELSELQNLAPYIEKDDLELREAAGIPEFPNDAEESQGLIEALKSFCDTVEQTGGLIPDPGGSGLPVPAASDDWIDLGEAYEQAVRALTMAGHLRTVSYDLSEMPLTEDQVREMNAVFDVFVNVQCKHCKFFIEQNFVTEGEDGPGPIKTFRTYFEFVDGNKMARYTHLDYGDTDHDHDAEPGIAMTSEEWTVKHPELFPYPGEDADDADSGYQARRKQEFGGVVSAT